MDMAIGDPKFLTLWLKLWYWLFFFKKITISIEASWIRWWKESI